MIGRLEFLIDFDVRAVAVLDFDVIPRIYINFLNARSENIFRKKLKFSHFGIELIHKLCLRQSLNGNAFVKQIFPDIPLDLIFYLIIAGVDIVDPVDDERGIFAGNLPLNLGQNIGEIPLFIRLEEQILCIGICN